MRLMIPRVVVAARIAGPTCGVEVTGLSRQVTGREASPLELMVYIP